MLRIRISWFHSPGLDGFHLYFIDISKLKELKFVRTTQKKVHVQFKITKLEQSFIWHHEYHNLFGSYRY